MLNFSYDPKQSKITMYILMIVQASEDWVYALILSGLIVNNSLLMPIDLPRWVHKGEIGKVNMHACMWQMGLGYTCTGDIYEGPHICLTNSSGKCHYNMQRTKSNHSAIVVVNQQYMFEKHLQPVCCK